jgi:hypothetical protein
VGGRQRREGGRKEGWKREGESEEGGKGVREWREGERNKERRGGSLHFHPSLSSPFYSIRLAYSILFLSSIIFSSIFPSPIFS